MGPSRQQGQQDVIVVVQYCGEEEPKNVSLNTVKPTLYSPHLKPNM